MDQVRDRIRRLGLARRTEAAYCGWIVRFIRAQGMRHPRDMGAPEVEAFLTLLATRQQVAASTQNQALAALLFLYREVLGVTLPWMDDIRRAKRPERLPVVLTREEVGRLLDRLEGVHWLVAGLLYGGGLRLMEALRLRVLDLDFGRAEVAVRHGKGGKDRRTVLAQPLVGPLQAHLASVRALHDRDLARGQGRTALPGALALKYPRAAQEWRWQFVFPAQRLSRDPRSDHVGRHHLRRKPGSEHLFLVGCVDGRSSVLGKGDLTPDGYDIRTVQELLGHADVSTTQIYTHVLNRGGRGVRSPLTEFPGVPQQAVGRQPAGCGQGWPLGEAPA